MFVAEATLVHVAIPTVWQEPASYRLLSYVVLINIEDSFEISSALRKSSATQPFVVIEFIYINSIFYK